VHEQTIWLPPRAVGFTVICEACEEEHPGLIGSAAATVSGSLRIDDDRGWATCSRGHTMRVLRMSTAMPAGALR
jgi:hypothetical protein